MKQKMFEFTPKNALLSVQHLFAMFGATVLVPLITGLNPATALATAGIGTLIFHLLTKRKVPVFLGSSFAFMGAIGMIVATEGPQYAQGGIMIAGLVYFLMATLIYLLVKYLGKDIIKKILPPVITGPIIVLIGISLATVGINDASGVNTFGAAPTGIQTFGSWMIALFTIVAIVGCMIYMKGFFKLIPILIGLGAGYALCLILWLCGWKDVLSFTEIANASWINIPYGDLWDASAKTNNIIGGIFELPKFSGTAILAIAPIALVTVMEHIGDITTNSSVCKQDFTTDPGFHRTLLGDGVATMVAGLLGGPANTTYSENTGVLAATKNYNPSILRLAALWAIGLAIFGKFGGFLQTIPAPVRGGVEIILFGMIAAIGIRTMIEAKLDLSDARNLITASLVLVVGVGLHFTGGIQAGDVNLSGLFVATLVGIITNLIFLFVKIPVSSDNEPTENEPQTSDEPAAQE